MKCWIILVALIWITKGFYTIDDMVKFLNTLPVERQMEAKIIACNSQRMLLSAYVLVYRSEA